LKFNTKVRYGIRAMVEIALDETDNGVLQKDIAERQKISVKYLDHIIPALKTAGLVVNKGGRKSGYIITRKPAEIRLLEIYNAFEPGVVIVDCISHNYICELSNKCGAKDFWAGLNNVIIRYFESYTVEDLIKEHKSKNS
jgi:Rrf2 family protein